MGNDAVDENKEGQTDAKPLREVSIYVQVLRAYLVATNPRLSSEEREQVIDREVRARSLELCRGDASQIDGNGFPKNHRAFRKFEEGAGDVFRMLKGLSLYDMRGEVNKGVARTAFAPHSVIDYEKDIQDKFIQTILRPIIVFCKAHDCSTTDLSITRMSSQPIAFQREVANLMLRALRDLVVLIGPDRYDRVRQKIGYSFFHQIDAETLIGSPADEITARLSLGGRTHSGYYRYMKGYLDDLILLAVDEELLTGIERCEVSPGTSSRQLRTVKEYANALQSESTVNARREMVDQRLNIWEYFAHNFRQDLFELLDDPIVQQIAEAPDDANFCPGIVGANDLHGQALVFKLMGEFGQLLKAFNALPAELVDKRSLNDLPKAVSGSALRMNFILTSKRKQRFVHVIDDNTHGFKFRFSFLDRDPYDLVMRVFRYDPQVSQEVLPRRTDMLHEGLTEAATSNFKIEGMPDEKYFIEMFQQGKEASKVMSPITDSEESKFNDIMRFLSLVLKRFQPAEGRE